MSYRINWKGYKKEYDSDVVEVVQSCVNKLNRREYMVDYMQKKKNSTKMNEKNDENPTSSTLMIEKGE